MCRNGGQHSKVSTSAEQPQTKVRHLPLVSLESLMRTSAQGRLASRRAGSTRRQQLRDGRDAHAHPRIDLTPRLPGIGEQHPLLEAAANGPKGRLANHKRCRHTPPPLWRTAPPAAATRVGSATATTTAEQHYVVRFATTTAE